MLKTIVFGAAVLDTLNYTRDVGGDKYYLYIQTKYCEKNEHLESISQYSSKYLFTEQAPKHVW
jgi:hypothetical protein